MINYPPVLHKGETVENKSKELILWEALCVVFWLLLDGFWLLEWKFLTYSAAFGAVFSATVMFVYLEKKLITYLVACAESLWILMGIFWATAGFYKLAWANSIAICCFVLSIVLLLTAYAKSDAKDVAQGIVMRRLRALRSALYQKK